MRLLRCVAGYETLDKIKTKIIRKEANINNLNNEILNFRNDRKFMF